MIPPEEIKKKDIRQVQSKDLDSLKLTDGEFLEWCGSHKVIGCGDSRVMVDDGEDIREVTQCEDCRVQAQIDKIKDNLPPNEEIRIRIIDYVMADGDTDKFIKWLERKLLVR